MLNSLIKKFNLFFSDKYVNHAQVVDNILLYSMYRAAYPFASFLNSLKISPNVITTLSLVSSILSFIVLVFDDGYILFLVFWAMTILFDFCDGTVARMSDNISKSAFRYDHMSDLFKVSLIILGTGIHYNEQLIWILTFAAAFVFNYADMLNREINFANNNKKEQVVAPSNQMKSSRLRERNKIIAYIVKYEILLKVYKNLRSALFTVNGHTLLLFLVFPVNINLAIIGLVYLISVELAAIKTRIVLLVKMRR
jgi:phosphatidylglycerophosphate synthase